MIGERKKEVVDKANVSVGTDGNLGPSALENHVENGRTCKLLSEQYLQTFSFCEMNLQIMLIQTDNK